MFVGFNLAEFLFLAFSAPNTLIISAYKKLRRYFSLIFNVLGSFGWFPPPPPETASSVAN